MSWGRGRNGYFPNLPTDQHFIYAILRAHPMVQTKRRVLIIWARIGLCVDGVADV